MKYTIYKITNLVNGMVYVGMTHKTIEERWLDHVSVSRGNTKRSCNIHRAIAEYGRNNFKIESIACTYDENMARKLEREWIRNLNAVECGYNVASGGNGNPKPLSLEIRSKIRLAQVGKVIPLESRRRMSEAKLGNKECAKNFGGYLNSGGGNPKARHFLIKFPDGSEHVISGLRAFCRDHCLQYSKLTNRGQTKGYKLLKKFIDYPEREYTQAGGNGGVPSGNVT